MSDSRRTAPTSHAIDAGGVRIVVHDWGGSGPPVLLVHPTGFHGIVWEPLAHSLVDTGRHVWSFDFRGHGDSDAPDLDYSWHGFADDALAVVADLGLTGDPALVACGHSKGGAALILGEQQQPGTYPRIWAYEPIMFESEVPLPPDEEFFLARTARKRRNTWGSPDEAMAAYASKPPLDALTDRSLQAYVQYGLRDRGDGTFELKCAPEIEARVYSMGPNHGAFAHLGELQSDVLVVCGERSKSISPELGATIAERIPRGRLEVLRGLGHFGPQQDPDACVSSILRFAERSSDASDYESSP